jgi:beta-lactamase regulating signal transducer with metallopeptidase domain
MSGLQVIPLLIECGFRASLPAGLAWAATRLAFRSSAATRHFIWACAIAIATLLPLSTIVTPRWNVAAPTPLARLASAARIEAVPSTTPSIASTDRIGAGAAGRPKDRRPGGLALAMVASWVWIMGAVVVFCYVLMGHLAAWRLYRTTRGIRDSWIRDVEQLTKETGLSSALRVVESPAASTPVVLHLWRPIIVMPEASGRWSRSRIRAVLLHEFAHIKRNDLHVQSIAQLACAVYWFNPLVWFAAHQLRVECERACDDFALQVGTSRADYATHLFEIAREGSASTTAYFGIGLAEYRSQLEQRLVAIMNPQTPRHSTTNLGRFIVALPMLLVALAAGAVQITARAIGIPVGVIKTPAPAIQVIADTPQASTGGTQIDMHSVRMESSTRSNSQPEEFHWVATMHAHQTVEVYLGRGSIQVLPSRDETVRVEARTDEPRHNRIQVVSTSTYVQFCNMVTTARESRNYCERNPETSQIEEDLPATKFAIYVPAAVHFSGHTVLGDITAEDPLADSDLATVNGNVTLELDSEEGVNFDGNVIQGEIDSDFPLDDNRPTLPTGEKLAMSAPWIVRGIVRSGGPHLVVAVVNGNIRLLRRSAG